jgi:hypothetical protein
MPAEPHCAYARGVIFAGLILLAVAAVAAIPVFDQGALEWFTEHSTCNDRPCTESEAKTIATVVSAVTGAIGLALLLAGVGRAVRGTGSAPGPSKLTASADEGYDARMEARARLDEAYGRGEVGEDEYRRRREQLGG